MIIHDRSELDRAHCMNPACQNHDDHGPLVLSSRCHPRAPQHVIFRIVHADEYHAMRVAAHNENAGTAPAEAGIADQPVGLIETSCKHCNLGIAFVRVSGAQQASLAEAVRCPDPACTHPPDYHILRLRSGCHHRAGLYVVYADGELLCCCARCKDVQASIAVHDLASLH